MMKLIPPAPEICLYKDSFADHDILNRRGRGEQLSSLIENIEDPLVVAIDGTWGSGKTFFLKCWVGAHKNEFDGTATTLYFDAFEHDFLDGPLLSLTGALSERLSDEKATKLQWKKLRAAVTQLWRPSARVALAAATAGTSEVFSSTASASVEAISSEFDKKLDEVWKREEGRRTAVAAFRNALAKIVEVEGKIAIVIDELDRCRPDYALATIEVMKHFFNIPNVYFVLGVNILELENMVKVRYGDKINAGSYLNKFITLGLSLPYQREDSREMDFVTTEYFRHMAKKMSVPDVIVETMRMYLEKPEFARKISLRMVDRILTQMALIAQGPKPFDRLNEGFKCCTAGLCLLKAIDPARYRLMRNGELDIDEALKFFCIDKKAAMAGSAPWPDHFLLQVWLNLLEPEQADRESRGYRQIFPGGLRDPKWNLRQIIEQYFEGIVLTQDADGINS